MKLSSSCSSASVTGLGGRFDHCSLGRLLDLHRCRKKGLGRIRREIGLDKKRVAKI